MTPLTIDLTFVFSITSFRIINTNVDAIDTEDDILEIINPLKTDIINSVNVFLPFIDGKDSRYYERKNRTGKFVFFLP